MDMDKVSAVLRRRLPWEATDLGITMVRSWWRAVWIPWLIVMGPIYALLIISLPWGWALFAILWIRPVSERLPLFVISRALFGAEPKPTETLRAVPRLFTKDFILPLTLGRLNPYRTFLLPVTQLEGQTGRARRRRCRSLSSSFGVTALGLTFSAAMTQICLAFGLFVIVLLMLPESDITAWMEALEMVFTDGGDWPTPLIVIFFGAFVTTELFLEPFHVGAGFGLYINRRTHLEGWDIELVFRSLRRRLEARGGPSRRHVGTTLLAAIFFGVLAPVSTLEASTTSSVSRSQDVEPNDAIREILSHDDFNKDRIVRRISWGDESRTDRSGSRSGVLIGEIIRVLLWVLIPVALVAISVGVILHFRLPRKRLVNSEDEESRPTSLFGFDLRPESLPDDVPGEVMRLWHLGQARASLGLLYRASLVDLVTKRDLPVRSSSTEGDCLRLFRSEGDPNSVRFFSRLTTAWQACAYAHRHPPAELVSSLCIQWAEHFEGRAR